jgi:hypothetical protein
MSGDDPTKPKKTVLADASRHQSRLVKDHAVAGLADLGPPPPPNARPSGSELPLVHLPSVYKPEQFLNASAARGARPASLKQIDEQLAAVERTLDPRERFERLRSLKRSVDDFVLRYGKDNGRKEVVNSLKKWVDGAIRLRERLFDPDEPL